MSNTINDQALIELKTQLALKFGLKGEDKLEILQGDLQDALNEVLDYTGRDELIGNMQSCVKKLYVVRYNQEGNEGETSRSEGGVSQSFETGIPKDIRISLNRYRIAKVRSL